MTPKLEEMENFFQKEKNELITQIEKNNETKPIDKTKLLEGTLQSLKKDLSLKDKTITELKEKINQLQEYVNLTKGAVFLKGSNLKENL